MQTWNLLTDKFAFLSQREKWLIFLSIFVGLFCILLILFVDPVQEFRKTKKSQLEGERGQIAQLEREISSLKQQLQTDPNTEINKELQKLLDESQSLSHGLTDVVSGLVSPSEMAELLEVVLDGSTTLKLKFLQSLPAEPILIEGKPVGDNYYIHPIRLELTGKYFDIQEYLAKLESMDVKYFWRSFRYEVEKYPKARFVLEVYTLGIREEFIGG